MTTPATRLSLLMEAYGDSLRTAAEFCGLDHTTLARVKNGDTENVGTLERIANGYGVPLDWLRGADEIETDFSIWVLTRPTQERVMAIWEQERRLPMALAFLHQYRPEKYAWSTLTERLGVTEAQVAGMVGLGHGSADQSLIRQFRRETGLPALWFEAGLVGGEDEHELLVGVAELTLSHLFRELDMDISPDDLHDIATALV